MRLNKKQRIIELIGTIEEGITYTLNCSENNAKKMLDDCIHGSLYIINELENEEVKDIVNIFIGEIKKSINNISNDDKFINSYEKMLKLLFEIKNKIINEIDTKIEIAFLPYKASMWDSMESVWESAKKDKDCLCYVVPIPYYERNDQGKICKVCYEGNLFPKEIEVTNFQEYSIEERQPDIIYIHNPYDNTNLLTVIDPKFFSDNLKKYTDMLVYIPYTVNGSYEKEKSFHWALLPGAINSTKIIAQSNIHRDLFLSVGHSENKVLNLGSPKFDATFRSSKKQYNINNNMDENLRDKKVFLLISTIDDILTDDNWVNNTKNTIENFKSRENCILIWREHPLTEVTIKAMRPNMSEEYYKLKNLILEYKNVIIDTNEDVNISINISNCLISGYSSVMLQYIITEKPILSFAREELLDDKRYYCTDYSGCYFTCRGTSINEFIEMILKNEDPKKDERIQRFRKSITNFNGTSGHQIHNTIKDEIMYKLIK